jgi:hypothetical protein
MALRSHSSPSVSVTMQLATPRHDVDRKAASHTTSLARFCCCLPIVQTRTP